MTFSEALRHHQAGRLGQAEQLYRTLLAQTPNHIGGLHLMGVLAAQTGREEIAVALIGRALELRPDYAEARLNLGNLLLKLDRPDEAEVQCRQALALRPDLAPVHASLGMVLYQQNRLAQAATHIRQALALAPDDALTHKNYGWVLLKQGDLAAGFREYDWRWAIKDFPMQRPNFPEAPWDGDDPAGRTILLYAEQGLGDTLQFVRYAPLLKRRGARVILKCQPELVRLLGFMDGPDQVLTEGDPRPVFDRHAALMSLPRLFGTTLATVPTGIPYLTPPPELVTSWSARVPRRRGLKVGLVWAGNPRPWQPEWAVVDRRRSMTLHQLAPLAAVAGVHWVSLQKKKPALAAGAPAPELALFDVMDQVADMADTAALIANLDLVIGVDTAVIHLAGAMGRPVWLLSRFDGCWRWLADRDDSPWYPSLRLFRQPRPGDWASVVAAVAAALSEMTRAR